MSNLLDQFNELEKQEIFFPDMRTLNDPMEGYKEMFWKGDAIAWGRLFEHYIYIFSTSLTIYTLDDRKFDETALNEIIFQTPLHLPEAPVRETFDSIRRCAWEKACLDELIAGLSNREVPIRRNELIFHLRTIHESVLCCSLKILSDKNLIKLNPREGSTGIKLDKVDIEQMRERHREFTRFSKEGSEEIERLFVITELMAEQYDLMSYYTSPPDTDRAAWFFICHHFPASYVNALDNLIYSPWYISSFSACPNNSAMWSIYGNHHTGACLKFKTKVMADGSNGIELLSLSGMQGNRQKTENTFSYSIAKLHPVTYTDRPPELNFFESIGAIPSFALRGFWQADSAGNRSSSSSLMDSDIDAWRSLYWSGMTKVSTHKLKDWAHEQEYRIVYNSVLSDLKDQNLRKLKYKFEDLSGIIFGSKTSVADKISVMKIVARKLKENDRKDFEFLQVKYLRERNEFCVMPLNMIVFDLETEVSSPDENEQNPGA